jgi:hypothetical protein
MNEVCSLPNNVRDGQDAKDTDDQRDGDKVPNHEHLSSNVPLVYQLRKRLVVFHPHCVAPANECEDECTHAYLHQLP